MRKTLAIFAVTVVGVILLLTLFFSATTPSHNLEIITVPDTAEIYIDNKELEDSGNQRLVLEKGQHTVTAKLSGFADQSSIVTIDDTLSTVVLPLLPVTPEARLLANELQNEYLEAEGIASSLSQESGAEFREENIIIKDLPFKSVLYSIDYGEDTEGFFLLISAEQAVGRQVALEKIRALGHEPSDYRIKFSGFSNPFKELE